MSSQLVTFNLAGAHYGLDMLRVQEVLGLPACTRVPLAAPSIAGLVNLRGQIVLTIDLRARLGLVPQPAEAEPMMIVVQVGGEPIGLLVDDLDDVVDVQGLPLEAPPETLSTSMREVVLGVHQLEVSLLLVLDVDSVTNPRGSTVPQGRPSTATAN